MTKRVKLWAFLGILAFCLFNYPLLQIFNRDVFWGGIPLLVLYLLGVWLLVIVILFLGRSFLSS
jgi:hypothetical protein